MAGGGVWIPYVPLYLSSLGLSGGQLGLVLALNPAMRWSSAIAWAYASDRWRIRRRLLLGGATASTLCLAVLLVTDSFAEVAAAILLLAFLSGPLVPMTDATVVDHLGRLGGDYGRVRAWGSIGFIAAALAGAAALSRFDASVVPWLLIAFQAGLPVAMTRLPREQLGHPEQFRAPWRLLSPPLAAFLASSFLLQMSAGAWAGFFAVYTRSLGLPDTIPGIAWGGAVASEVAVLFAGRWMISRLSAPDLMIFVLAVTVVRYTLTAVVTSAGALVLLQLFYGLSFAGFHLAAQMLIARLVPARSSTNGQALYGFVSFGLGGSLGLALAGALIEYVGPARLFLVEALVACLAIAPALWLRRLHARER